MAQEEHAVPHANLHDRAHSHFNILPSVSPWHWALTAAVAARGGRHATAAPQADHRNSATAKVNMHIDANALPFARKESCPREAESPAPASLPLSARTPRPPADLLGVLAAHGFRLNTCACGSLLFTNFFFARAPSKFISPLFVPLRRQPPERGEKESRRQLGASGWWR